MKRINHWISAKNWDHEKFLKYLLLIMVCIILFLYGWVFLLGAMQTLPSQVVQNGMYMMTKGIILGLLVSILVSFLLLLFYYLRKEWDLHIVVPQFLILHLMVFIIIVFAMLFLKYNQFLESGFNIGYGVGGLLTILAYVGEVKREHSTEDGEEELVLIEDND